METRRTVRLTVPLVVVITDPRYVRGPVDPNRAVTRLLPRRPSRRWRSDRSSTITATQEFSHDGVPIRETLVRFGKPRPERDRQWSRACRPTSTADAAPRSAGGGHLGTAYVVDHDVGSRATFRGFCPAGGGARVVPVSGSTCLDSEPARVALVDAWADFYHPGAQDEIAEAVDHMVGLGFEQGRDRRLLCGCLVGRSDAAHIPSVSRIVGINLQLFIRRRLLHRRPWPDLPPWPTGCWQRVAQRPQVCAGSSRSCNSFIRSRVPTLRWIRRQRRAGVDVTLIFAARGSWPTSTTATRSGQADMWRPWSAARHRRFAVTTAWGTFRQARSEHEMLDEIHSLS